jgi:hypothetical protein
MGCGKSKSKASQPKAGEETGRPVLLDPNANEALAKEKAPRLTTGASVKIMVQVLYPPATQGLIGNIIVDDNTDRPYKVEFADGTVGWYKEEQVMSQAPNAEPAKEDAAIEEPVKEEPPKEESPKAEPIVEETAVAAPKGGCLCT